jgi:predicted TIM-barrel fold metal-dependent hydrolase
MKTRRALLQATALGIAGTAFPDLVHGSSSEAEQTATRADSSPRSMVDFHAHWIGPRVVELLSARTSPRPPQGQAWFDIDARLRDMDQAGVQRQVLSYVGAAYDGVVSPEDARPLWRAQNDDLAALVRKHPTRFSGLATLPTANVAWAADELQRAHQELGLIGATLPLDAFISLAGARALAPIFAAAQKHRSHIFVHRGAASADIPGRKPEVGDTNPYFGLASPDSGNPRPAAVIGDNPSARALLMTATHLATGVITLALTDFLDPYSDVTVQVAMMGGAIPYVAEQIQMAAEAAGEPVPAKRFRSVYLDTGQSGRGPRGIALAAKVFGADRILFGTDSGPTSSVAETIASVKQAPLTTEEKQQIFVENGRRLLEARGVK